MTTTETTSDPSPSCPRCGYLLAADAPEGLCPRCLAAINFGGDTLFSGDDPSLPPPPPIEEMAPHFPQLEILSCLGRGGMGVVYKARQISLDRLVALKLLAPEREKDPEFSERFAREAQALARMSHPHIVTVHDFGQAGGFFYLLMEFVDGANLRQLLQAHKFTPEQALGVVPPLCDALQYAHDRGIVHRDIKPENLLMARDGRLKVADFGLVKMLGTDADGDDRPMGTPDYMAPEQSGDPTKVDNRADIYSLGVVIYEMLTGELPGRNFQPPSMKAGVDSRLDEVVHRAMEQEPSLRYQQASILKTQVEKITRTPQAVLPPRLPEDVKEGIPTDRGSPQSRQSIRMAASAMMILCGVAVCMLLLDLVVTLFAWLDIVDLSSQFAMGPGGGGRMGAIAIFSLGRIALFIAGNVVAYLGADRMRKLESWQSGLVSAVLVLTIGLLSFPSLFSVSASSLIVLGQIGIGIWALVLLLRENVKPLFKEPVAVAFDAKERLAIPARGLMGVSVFNVLLIVLAMGSAVFGYSRGPHGWTIFSALCGLPLSAITFVAAWRMWSAKNRVFAIIGALCVLVTPPVFIFGIAFGVWALVVLLDSRVKAAFAGGRGDMASAGKTKGGKKTLVVAGAICLAVLLAVFAIPLGVLFLRFKGAQAHPINMHPTFPLEFESPEFPPMGSGRQLSEKGTPSSPEELITRLNASGLIQDVMLRLRVLAAIANDAAASGNMEMVGHALGQIHESRLHDETSRTVAFQLVDLGLREEAMGIMSGIKGVAERDSAFAEISRRAVAPPAEVPEASQVIPVGPSVADSDAPQKDFKTRFDASGRISNVTVKDDAFSTLAKEAAQEGDVAVVRRAIEEISMITLRDETAMAVAFDLTEQGLRKEAVEIASRIKSVTVRDKALAELATRKSPPVSGDPR